MLHATLLVLVPYVPYGNALGIEACFYGLWRYKAFYMEKYALFFKNSIDLCT